MSKDGVLLDAADAAPLLEGSEEEMKAAYAAQEAQLQYEHATTLSQGGTEIVPPGTVALVEGPRITSNELRTITYTSMGVFIVGAWDGSDEQQQVLVPWDKVMYVSLNFDLMVDLLQAEAEAAGAES